MFEKVFPFNRDFNQLDWKRVLFVIFCVTLIVRFPFFFRDYVDRDESTFILLGQSWADGFLPYTQLWDLKPPITFGFFAVIISLFGKSFIAIRFFGSLLVVGTALCTYFISKRMTSPKTAFWVAIGTVVFLSLFGSLQGVMSEHISIFFFTLGITFLVLRTSFLNYFLVGLFFGLAIMAKLNMAYPALFVGLYLGWAFVRARKLSSGFMKLVLIALGVFLIVGLTALPYYSQGNFDLWFSSVFEAPLAYSNAKHHSATSTLPIFLLVGLLFFLGYWKKLLPKTDCRVTLLVVTSLGVLLSFMQAGKINGHYLIQFYPFVLVLLGIVFEKLPRLNKKFYPILLLLLFVPMESYLEYANIIKNKSAKGSFFNGEGIDIPNYLKAEKLDDKSIFFTEYHIGYWLLDKKSPTVASTHPSNVTREELFPFMRNSRDTAQEELEYITGTVRPELIVARKNRSVFDGRRRELNKHIDSILKVDYKLIQTIDKGLIYQKIN
ncbi:MAG: glycosyltransferase family 39 protein [Bacteroidota bacterium]